MVEDLSNKAILFLLDEERWCTAERAALRRLDADGRDFRALELLAAARTGLFRYEEAEADLRRLLGEAPRKRHHKAAFRIGMLFRKRGMFAEAADAYRLAMRLDPEEAAFVTFLGELLLSWGRPDEAVKVLSKGLQCHKGPIDEVLLNLALAYRALGDLEEARRCLVQSLAMDPEREETRVALEDLDCK